MNKPTSYQTVPLQRQHAHELSLAVARLCENEIDPGLFNLTVHRGSVTVQHLTQSHRVLKLFFDHNGSLPGSHEGALVLGIELSHARPWLKEDRRNGFAARFGNDYLDPRKPEFNEYQLLPNPYEHTYDLILFDSVAEWTPGNPDLQTELEQSIQEILSAGIAEGQSEGVAWPGHAHSLGDEQRMPLAGIEE